MLYIKTKIIRNNASGVVSHAEIVDSASFYPVKTCVLSKKRSTLSQKRHLEFLKRLGSLVF